MKRGRWYTVVSPAGRPLRWVLPGALIAGLLLLQGFVPGWADWAEGRTVDARFALRGVEAPRNRIVIVALDEDSFQMMGGLKGENVRAWPRARWAQLVERIAAGNPRFIALDVLFDTPGWDAGGDEALVGALARAGNVVLAANYEQVSEGTHAVATISAPLPSLEEQAAAVGVAAFPQDADGAIRRMGLLYPDGKHVRPAFPLAAATLFAGKPLAISLSDLEQMGGVLPIHFRGPEGTFETVSLHRLFADELTAQGVLSVEGVDPATFDGAIVLVGYTTRSEHDRHRAPFTDEAGMPGVEVNANAIDTLLAGDWLRSSPRWLAALAVGVMGVGALAAFNLRRPGVGAMALVGMVAGHLALGQALFAWANFLLPLVAPVAAAVAVGGVALAERLVFAERDKRRLRQRFAGVMSPERLQAVLDDWEGLMQVERPQKEAAVLFADVRGFTNATETLMRQGRIPEMVGFLTAYLDAMAEAVFVEGGAIYDVVGDGLMILFGVPVALPDYPLRAVRGAVRMALATEALQAVWLLRDQRPLRMGIGVHCGSVVDAVVGRGRRVEYSVIGDPVNTAARIEAHCKEAMAIPRPPGGQVPETVTVLLSADLYGRVREHVLVDESVPPFEARGKSEPLRVVRLLGLRQTV